MTEEARRGKNVVIGIIVFSVGISALSVVLQLLVGNVSIADFVRFALNVLMCVFLYRGSAGARWIFVALSGIGGLGGLVIGLLLPMDGLLGPVLLALGAGYLACAALVVWNRSVRAYFADVADAG